MKSGTSCFKSLLLKDITRFSPVWGLYTVCLFLGLMLMAGGEVGASLPSAMATCISLMPLVNSCYGLAVAQVLFGDLHNSRLCYGLHSLPVKRERWFAVHTVSGLLFSLAPTALMTAVALALMVPGCQVENVWQIGAMWWLGTNLQYIFFFGAGILSMMLSGSRLGGALIYAVINLAAVGFAFLYAIIYIPMFYGFQSQENIFYWFAPLVQMCSMEYFDTDFSRLALPGGSVLKGTFEILPNWWYLFACGGVGVLLGQLGLEAYRRRNLEVAGNTVAFRWIKPFFLMAASLACAVGTQFVLAGVFGVRDLDDRNLRFFVQMLISLAVGWIAGAMILSRTTRIFTKKILLGFVAFTTAFLLTIGIAWLDPLGLETRIPDMDDIQSATLYTSAYGTGNLELTEPEDLENIRILHESALKNRLTGEAVRHEGQQFASWNEMVDYLGEDYVDKKGREGELLTEHPMTYYLTYTLKNGQTVKRQYRAFPLDPDGQVLKIYLTRFDYLTNYPRADALAHDAESAYIEGIDEQFTDKAFILKLAQAIEADCQAGTMAQNSQYHSGYVYEDPRYDRAYRNHYIYFACVPPGMNPYQGARIHVSFYIYAECENTLAFLEAEGLLDKIYR